MLEPINPTGSHPSQATLATQGSLATHINIAHECLDRHLLSAHPTQGSHPTQATLATQGTVSKADQTAMIFVHESRGRREFTYRQLTEATQRVAGIFQSAGLSRGHRILLLLSNSEWFPISFFAALRLGAIPVPASMLLTGEEVSYLIRDSGAQVVVSEPQLFDAAGIELLGAKLFMAGQSATLGAQDLTQAILVAPLIRDIISTLADDPAYLVYTSGTTGYPKGVLHAHRALYGRLPSGSHWFHFGEHERILHSGKFNWTYVLGTGMMDPLFHGKSVVVYEGKNDAAGWVRLIAEEKCTTFIGVPTIYRQILQKTEFTAEDVPTLRHCMCAGEHLSEPVQLAWRERFGMNIYEGLGMSECSYYISQNRTDEIRPGSAGKIQPWHLVELLDENFQPVAPDEEGVLCIRREDAGLFICYWNLPEENAKVFHVQTCADGTQQTWFVTGDYARMDREGYIWFIGRKDDIIKSFGYRLSPYEIERVMKGHPDISDCAAVPEVIDAEKTIVALCVMLKNDAHISESEILAWSKGHLAEYKRPKKVYILPDFPRTANGKILRKNLLAKVHSI